MNDVPESSDKRFASAEAQSIESGKETPCLDSLPTDEFLRVVGMRVRSQRATTGMSRKRLAEVSGVSERYLAQLESGQGNMSIALLRKVTSAIGMPLGVLLSAQMPDQSAEMQGAHQAASPVDSEFDSATGSTHHHVAASHGATVEINNQKRHLVPEL